MRLTAIFVLLFHWVYAQTPQVPHKMTFAGITLSIRDDARKEIQKDVDALTQYAKYFNIKVDRAKTYFPIIEKIFEEERLPDDFKYLVLQESALIADAVSVSNAVGFWQFKDFTAMEMGLRVDKEIDERMNIASSTRAAAQYIKKNNHYFNNWVYALQAYQMGAGGVMRSLSDYESGARHMEITSQTYWYVRKFLAHKIAFENAIKGPVEVKIIAYENFSKKSLTELSREVSIPVDQLEEYNKWIRKGTIPDDRKYNVAIPVQGDSRAVYAAVAKANVQLSNQPDHGRKLDAKPAMAIESDRKFIHGLPAVKAERGESSASIAKRSGVSLSTFLSFNDLSITDQVITGQYYYLKKKKTKAQTPQHTVTKESESMWSVSQQHGIQLKKIKKLNPSLSLSALKPGTIVTLPSAVRSITLIEPQEVLVEVETGEFFNWSVNSQPDEIKLEAGLSQKPTYTVSAPERESNQSLTIIPESSSPGQHVVTPGETLYAISKKYNVGVMELVDLNQLKLDEGIKPGQVLKIKSTPSTDTAKRENAIIYEVKPSDTLYSVARQYGVTIKELMDWNKKKDFSVSTGEKLVILQK